MLQPFVYRDFREFFDYHSFLNSYNKMVYNYKNPLFLKLL